MDEITGDFKRMTQYPMGYKMMDCGDGYGRMHAGRGNMFLGMTLLMGLLLTGVVLLVWLSVVLLWRKVQGKK